MISQWHAYVKMDFSNPVPSIVTSMQCPQEHDVSLVAMLPTAGPRQIPCPKWPPTCEYVFELCIFDTGSSQITLTIIGNKGVSATVRRRLGSLCHPCEVPSQVSQTSKWRYVPAQMGLERSFSLWHTQLVAGMSYKRWRSWCKKTLWGFEQADSSLEMGLEQPWTPGTCICHSGNVRNRCPHLTAMVQANHLRSQAWVNDSLGHMRWCHWGFVHGRKLVKTQWDTQAHVNFLVAMSHKRFLTFYGLSTSKPFRKDSNMVEDRNGFRRSWYTPEPSIL